jgi:biotin carboxyl carrier protein
VETKHLFAPEEHNFTRKTGQYMGDKNETFMVKANEFLFEITQEKLESTDMINRSATEFHLIKDHRSVAGKVHESDMSGKKLRIEVEGDMFYVEIKDRLDQMLEKMGFGIGGGKRIEHIRAPMPGLVLQISVTEGQEVKDGDPILILEAMKMENSIMLQHSAKIKKIHVKRGQPVEKGQVLVELE